MMAHCLIALGSNLGDRADYLRRALRDMARLAHVRLLLRSSWRETVPVGGPLGQEPYLNGAVLLETQLTARVLLKRLLEIECRLGRQRSESPTLNNLSEKAGLSERRWSSRTIDLDLLLHGSHCCESVALRLPHPRMSFRRFVLEPAVEIAGWMPHPTSGLVLARLLWRLNTAEGYVAIVATGLQASARHAAKWLAHELALALGWPWRKYESPLGLCQVPTGVFIYCLQPGSGLQPCSADGEELVEKPNVHSCRGDIAAMVEPAHLGPEKNGAGNPKLDRTSALGLSLREPFFAPPKLVIAWEKRVVKDRMVELIQGAGQGECQSNPRLEKNLYARGPFASILTADPRQALAEALAAIQAIWPAEHDLARGIPQR